MLVESTWRILIFNSSIISTVACFKLKENIPFHSKHDYLYYSDSVQSIRIFFRKVLRRKIRMN